MENADAIARFSAFASLTDRDLADLAKLVGPTRELKRREVLRHEGEAQPALYFLRSGWTASSIAVRGGAQQMVKVHLPGDMVGLPSLALTQAADTITALTAASVHTVPRSGIGELFETSPRLAALLFLISQEERVMLTDRLASLGRTKAMGRFAALIIQLRARLLRSNPETGETFELPLTQYDLASMTGLTAVHINRTLQQLRADDIISWKGRSVTILNSAALRRIAGLPERHVARDQSWLPRGQVRLSADEAGPSASTGFMIDRPLP